uniref:Response regulator n=1 Tax=Phenylobacterium glaciei TaxID=2803784 RepID=A0A974P1U9_9CAUL|nr:response regulator [Phenylobacterium glaciei]
MSLPDFFFERVTSEIHQQMEGCWRLPNAWRATPGADAQACVAGVTEAAACVRQILASSADLKDAATHGMAFEPAPKRLRTWPTRSSPAGARRRPSPASPCWSPMTGAGDDGADRFQSGHAGLRRLHRPGPGRRPPRRGGGHPAGPRGRRDAAAGRPRARRRRADGRQVHGYPGDRGPVRPGDRPLRGGRPPDHHRLGRRGPHRGQRRGRRDPGLRIHRPHAVESTGEEEEEDFNAPHRAAHILVVDDNATNRMVAETLCEMFDCTSESAVDGVEALEAARTGRFDLILMDIKMPRMDGVTATHAIRALPGAAGLVPIIALTANADPEDAVGYLAAGMNGVVEKPMKPENLLRALQENLGGGSGEESVAA